jgi:hypothetical protein
VWYSLGYYNNKELGSSVGIVPRQDHTLHVNFPVETVFRQALFFGRSEGFRL